MSGPRVETGPRSVILYRRDRGAMTVTGTPQLALPLNVNEVGEIRVYRFVLPFLPPSKNAFDQWPNEWKHSVKKKWLKRIAEECESSQVPKGIGQVGLAATLIFGSKNRRDPQNYSNCLWHWVPDGLVQAGVLVDDNEGRIELGPNWGLKFAYDLRREVAKKKRERTVLSVTMRVP